MKLVHNNKKSYNPDNLRDKHQKDLGFSVPEGYFSQAKQDILNKIELEDTYQSTPTFFQNKRNVWIVSIAASLLIGMFLINTFTNGTNTVVVEEDVLIASLVTDDVDSLLDTYITDEFLTEEIFSE